MAESKPGSGDDVGAGNGSRRGFFSRLVALGVGGVAVVVPAIVGLVTALNPLRQKSQTGQLVRLTTLAALPEDGSPRKFPVIVDRVDAWNYFPDEPIGSVFLRRTGDASQPVEALHAICPHAGCMIQIASGSRQQGFICPCHAATFDLEGKRLQDPSQSPRDMDTLDVEIRDGEEVWVVFQNFKTGTSKKVAQA
jgi:menaquinol-cytochrome c reductase iron-sulfur subunit